MNNRFSHLIIAFIFFGATAILAVDESRDNDEVTVYDEGAWDSWARELLGEEAWHQIEEDGTFWLYVFTVDLMTGVGYALGASPAWTTAHTMLSSVVGTALATKSFDSLRRAPTVHEALSFLLYALEGSLILPKLAMLLGIKPPIDEVGLGAIAAIPLNAKVLLYLVEAAYHGYTRLRQSFDFRFENIAF